MLFRKLEILGFKSFCEKTILHFDSGITAVVGPNGSGKSNVLDSIRWVLGEQSAKSLRGTDMQDVIFNGTDLKEPLGMAEVSLTFGNENRFFNIDHPEVTITRRLFRSGESEYLLNKASVRLKDISDLLMGTGIGAESYSLIAQGKIDLVLSLRPEDRRQVFDEAAGITKYKSQKRETMRKLEETEQNLLRVSDIVAEVKRQIASLERQANKARKYKEAFDALKDKEITLGLSQKKELLAKKEGLESQLNLLKAREAELEGLAKAQESKMAGSAQELKIREENLMRIKERILSLENLIARSSEHINFNKERILELTKTIEYLEAQGRQLEQKIILDEEKLNSLKSKYDNIRNNIEEKSVILAQNQAQINGLAACLKNSLEAIAKAKNNLLELAGIIANTKNQLSDFNSKQQLALARRKRLEVERLKASEELSSAQKSLTSTTEEVESLKNLISCIELKISDTKGKLGQEQSSLEALEGRIDSLEKQKLTLESHKEFLQKLKTEYEGIGECMNAFIYLDKPPAENLSGLVVKIKEHINLSEEDKKLFNSCGLKLSGEAKPIELDTDKIECKINKLSQDLTSLRAQKAVKLSLIKELDKEGFSLQQELRSTELGLANKEAARLTALEQFNKIKEEQDLILFELEDIGQELALLDNSIAVTQAALSRQNSQQAQEQDSIQKEEQSISANSKLREEALVAITKAKAELDSFNKSIESDKYTLKILEETHQQDKGAFDNINKQRTDAEAKIGVLEEEIRKSEDEIANNFRAEVEKQNNLLKEANAQYEDISLNAQGLAENLKSERVEAETVKNKMHTLDMEIKEIEYKYGSLSARLIQAYKVDLEGLDAGAVQLNMEALFEEIESLKDRLESLGSVNLVAIEEYDELKKRYDFLIQQQLDLSGSKESLHQAILKINRTTKQMFLETFEKVCEEFRNYFRMLFSGGDAKLILMDEQDPLESGIEIICRPPGKKLQNILLLSGGEKSMAAIALIFAIFKIKPSPFCILDEIDAALDEANVDRLGRALQEFSQDSQFIVITHNKKTISNANVMYGITMEQSGVSKIVSVKFAEDSRPGIDKNEPEAALPETVSA